MAPKKAVKKPAEKSAPQKSSTPPSKRWSAKVTTDSTKPGPGLFKKSAKQIAEGLASKSVSPEGPGQGMRMLNFYENRGGKNLSSERKHVLEDAKKLLHEKVEESHTKKFAKKSPTKKSVTKKPSKAAKKANS